MLFTLMLVALVHHAVGYANFLLMIPNGKQVGSGWHALGHTRPLPDLSMPQLPFKRNHFGKDFFRAGHKWTRALCESDSDGDGLSNGEELGDPHCIWQVGHAPSRTHNITHPGLRDNPRRNQTAEAESDVPSSLPSSVPPSFRVSNAGVSHANGVYALITKNPEAYVWDRRVGKTYVWRSLDQDCSVWLEKHSSWSISCNDGDRICRGGGNGSFPMLPLRCREAATKLEPLQERPPPPAMPANPRDKPLSSIHAYIWLIFVIPSFILLAWMLSLRYKWLPPVRWNLVILGFCWLLAGTSIGHHRLFSHRAFKAGFWTKNALALAGAMCLQDNFFMWASIHRVHHRACDQELDFHSPVASQRGFWFSHAAWLNTPKEHPRTRGDARIDDLLEDDDLKLAQHYSGDNMMWLHFFCALLAAVCVTACYKCYRKSKFQLPILTFYYLGTYAMLPVFTVWHTTSMINSVTHMWGERPYVDGMVPHIDSCESHNVPWLFPLQLGETWHNNHHAAPGSASTWVQWYQVDVIFLTIRAMEAIGLVWDVRVELPAATRQGYEAGGLELPIMQAFGCGLVALIVWKLQRSTLGSFLSRSRKMSHHYDICDHDDHTTIGRVETA